MSKFIILMVFVIFGMFLLVAAISSSDTLPYASKDIFTKLIENQADISSGYAIFEVTNPTIASITVDNTKLSSTFSKYAGKQVGTWQLETPTNVFYSEKITDYKQVCNDTITNITNNTHVILCSNVENGYHWFNYTAIEWKPIKSVTLLPSEKKQFKLSASWPAHLGLQSIEWIPRITIAGTDYYHLDWAWWNSSYNYRMNATMKFNITADTTYHNFLLNGTSGINTAELIAAGKMQANCKDIRITNSAGALTTAYEFDSYESATNGCNTPHTLIWVRAGALKADNTTVYSMYYGGGAGAPFGNATEAVPAWDNSYKFVLHFKENTGTNVNTSVNRYSGTLNGGNSKWINAAFGTGMYMGGVDSVDYIAIPNPNVGATWTYEVWANMTSGTGDPTGYRVFMDMSASGVSELILGYYHNVNELEIKYWEGANHNLLCAFNPNGNQYYYIVFVWDNQKAQIWVNGTLYCSNAAMGADPDSNPIRLGESIFRPDEQPFSLDEVRFSDIARDGDYIRTQWQNYLNYGLFLSSTEESGYSNYTTVNGTINGTANDVCVYPCIGRNITFKTNTTNVNISIYKNGTLLKSQLSDINGIVTYWSKSGDFNGSMFNITGKIINNGTIVGSINTTWLNVTKATTSMDLYVNGTKNLDTTIRNNSFVNLTVIGSFGGTVYLMTNRTGWQEASGTSPYVNNTVKFNVTTIGNNINATAYYKDTINYTASVRTQYLTMAEVGFLSGSYSTEVLESDSAIFWANYTLSENVAAVNSMYLIYNNTWYYQVLSWNNMTTSVGFNRTITVPAITAAKENVTFYWSGNFTYTDGTFIIANSSSFIQNISKPAIGACTASNVVGMTLRFWDEVPVNGSFQPVNSTANYYIYFTVGGILYQFNATISNTTSNICIYPTYLNASAYGLIQYQGNVSGVYAQRDYWLDADIIDNTSRILNLYNLLNSSAVLIKINLKDQYLNPITDTIIRPQRYYPELNAYATVSSLKTDGAGQTNGFLTPYTVYYRFVIQKNGNIIQTIPSMLITSSELSLSLSLKPFIDWLLYWNMITGSVTYDDPSGYITGTYSDTSGYLNHVRLKVSQVGALEIFEKCNIVNNTVPSGQIRCYVGNASSKMFDYSLVGYLNTGENDEFLIAKGILNEGYSSTLLFGNCNDPSNILACKEGLIIAFFLVLGCALIGIYSPVASLVMMGVGMIFTWSIGMVAISIESVIGLMFLIGLFVYRMRSGGNTA